MKPFESKSQAGQDRYCWDILGPGPGTFLDIGSGHPSEKSNTFALEQQGWTGILVETDAYCVGLIKALRGATLIAEDATKIDWAKVFHATLHVDYLSLDVDFASLEVLSNLMGGSGPPSFSVITLEHDSYRFGTKRRDEMVAILQGQDYEVLCADVSDKGLPFEIWAVDPLAVDMAKAERFRRSGAVDWKEFWA